MSLHKFLFKISSFIILWILKLQIRDCGPAYIGRVQVSINSDFITIISEKKALALVFTSLQHLFSPLFSPSSTCQGTIS